MSTVLFLQEQDDKVSKESADQEKENQSFDI